MGKSLPEDVLHIILEFVAENEKAGRPIRPYDADTNGVIYDKAYYTKSLGWIRLGHVSRLWRLVTTRSRTLWAASIGTLPAGLHDMMERAGTKSLLDVNLYMGERRSAPVEVLSKWLLARGTRDIGILPRIRAVHIGFLGRVQDPALDIYPLNILQGLFRHELPNFCHFETSPLCSRHGLFNGLEYVGDPFFTIYSRSTKTVSMINYFARWNTPALVSLVIELGDTRTSGPQTCCLPPAEDLFDLLRPCAATLERIEIGGAKVHLTLEDFDLEWGFGASPPRTESSRIDLPRLEYIKLYVPPAYMETVLGRLSYPKDALTRVDMPRNANSNDSFKIIPAKYPRQWAALRMHDGEDNLSDTGHLCYLDFYAESPALLAVLDDAPWAFHVKARPQVSYRIASNNCYTAKIILHDLGVDSMGVRCASLAVRYSTTAPLTIPFLAEIAHTFVIESPYENDHSLLATLSFPVKLDSMIAPAGLDPVDLSKLKKLYVIARPGGSKGADPARLLADLGRRETWDGVELHVDAALSFGEGDGHSEDTLRAELLTLFGGVHWRERRLLGG